MDIDIVLLEIIDKLVSAIGAVFPNAKNSSPIELIILATVVLSAIISIFPSVNSVLNKKTIRNSFDSLMYSLLGGLADEFAVTAIGLLLSSLIYLNIPPQWDYIGDFFYPIRLMVFIFICLFLGILIGENKTIKPLIRFFSARNR